jgi:hypothetical protein
MFLGWCCVKFSVKLGGLPSEHLRASFDVNLFTKSFPIVLVHFLHVVHQQKHGFFFINFFGFGMAHDFVVPSPPPMIL